MGDTLLSGGDNTTSSTPADSNSPADSGTSTPSTFEGPEWLANLPEDLKSTKSLHKFKDVEGVARGYANAESLIGRDKIPMPKTDEEWANTYSRLGRPETADAYELQAYDVSPDFKAQFDEDLAGFKAEAFRLGLSNKQADGVLALYMGRTEQANERYAGEIETATRKAEESLRSEYGQAYDAKLKIATRTLANFGSQGLTEAVNVSGLGRNPEFIKFLVKTGESNLEDLGIDKHGQSASTKADIRSKIMDLQSDPAYTDATHPQHDAAVERVRMLFGQLTTK